MSHVTCHMSHVTCHTASPFRRLFYICIVIISQTHRSTEIYISLSCMCLCIMRSYIMLHSVSVFLMCIYLCIKCCVHNQRFPSFAQQQNKCLILISFYFENIYAHVIPWKMYIKCEIILFRLST
jgi:hypothetical protein